MKTGYAFRFSLIEANMESARKDLDDLAVFVGTKGCVSNPFERIP